MTASYLIDTDTFIYIKNHHPPQVLEHFREMKAGAAFISVITYGELYRGCERSNFKQKNHHRLNQLINIIPVKVVPENAGKAYGRLRANLEKKGNVIGNNDMWIAAHAVALDLTLVTNNTKEFSRVDGLRTENWV